MIGERGDRKYPSPPRLWVRPFRVMGRTMVYQVCRGNEGVFGRLEILAEFPESEEHLADAFVKLATEET